MKKISLTKGKVASVDDRDFEKLNQFSWYALRVGHNFYAARTIGKGAHGPKRCILMHREILPGYPRIDHRDNEGLNNCRGNLRPANCSQNAANSRKRTDGSSKFKGVHWLIDNQKWRASVKFCGENIYLGCFVSESEAARAYDDKAKALFGEFARLNFSKTA